QNDRRSRNERCCRRGTTVSARVWLVRQVLADICEVSPRCQLDHSDDIAALDAAAAIKRLLVGVDRKTIIAATLWTRSDVLELGVFAKFKAEALGSVENIRGASFLDPGVEHWIRVSSWLSTSHLVRSLLQEADATRELQPRAKPLITDLSQPLS